MGTRACYVFYETADEQNGHVIFKHYDGYPKGAVVALAAGRDKTFPLPRYEASAAAAGFIAANHDGGADTRVFGYGDWKQLISGDTRYVYLVRPDHAGNVIVTGVNVETEAEHFREPLASIERAKIQ